MRKELEINKKIYTPAEMTFNNICLLEEMGVTIENAGKKRFSLLRAYLAISAGCSVEYAGKELEQHLMNGGDFENIDTCLSEAIDESDFFQALSKAKAEKAGEMESKEAAKE